MSQIRLKLLGQPEVWVGQRAVKFATRKAQALLVYLAVQGGATSRESLTALLWPESGPAQGRATLRSTLAFLRSALGPAASEVAASRDSISLEPEPDSDIQQLAEAAKATRQLPLAAAAAGGLSALQGQLQTAAGLYRGDFLEGFSLSDAPAFDDWASLQREVSHRQAAVVFDWLSQLQMDGGDTLEAIGTLQRWLALDPLNEAGHRRLIQLHYANGDSSAALQAYELCRAVLARELKAEPMPETQALVERIRARGASAADASARGLAHQRRLNELGLPPAMAEAPLIGRTNEHLALVRAFRLARRGQPQFVIVEGEPGIGKTRLMKEFLAWAAGEGAEVLHGRAYEAAGALPYQPIVDALRDWLSSEPDPRRWLSQTWWAELSRLLPELAEAMPDLPRPLALAEGEARGRLIEAVVRLGSALAAAAPLVVFMDDAQWADRASLDLLVYMGQRFAQAPARFGGLLVVALRAEDLATDPALADWFGSFGHRVPLTHLSLGPLTLEDLRRLVAAAGVEGAAAATPGDIDALSRRLFDETGGQPFFAVQTLRFLSESRARRDRGPDGAGGAAAGGAADSDPDRLRLPSSVRALIRARLARLSANGTAACAAGAVLGAGFEFGTLCQVSELEEAAGLPAVEELLARGLLREAPGQSERTERLYFSHDKIRETAYGDLSAARRRVLHRRALRALENLAASPGELARHALAADERRPAFQYSVAAGDAASRVFAVREALAYYAQAEALAGTGQPDGGRQTGAVEFTAQDREHLLLQLGAAHEAANDWPAAIAVYERLLAQARAADLPAVEGIALNRLALVAAKSRFDIQSAAVLLQAAQAAADRSGDAAVLAETEMNLSQMGLYRWDARMLRSHGERALALAREIGQPGLAARALNMLAYSGVVSGKWESIETLAKESWQLYASLGNRAMEADSLALMGGSQTQNGRAREALATGRAAYAICLEIENEWGQANTAFHLANTLLELGEIGEALEIGRQGVAAARAAGHPPLLVFNLGVCGSVYRAALAVETARVLQLEAQAVAAAVHQPYLMEWAAAELCADFVAGGDWAEAYDQAERALAVRAIDPSLKSYAGLTRWCQTEALLHHGLDGAQRAAEDLQRLDQQTSGAFYRRYRLVYLRAKAACELLQAPGAGEGLRTLQAAAALADELDLPVELWQINARLGAAYRAGGNEEQAEQAFERAARLVQRLADKIGDDEMRAAFLSAALP